MTPLNTPKAAGPKPSPAGRHRQRGISLIEILVGLTIGLLVVGVALGAVQVARQLVGTTSEAARLQQQAAYAMRVIGTQVRQAGALQLNLAFNRTAPETGFLAIDPADPVAFDVGFDRKTRTLGSSDSQPLQTGYAYYREQLSTDTSNPDSLLRDCLGDKPSGAIVASAFFLQKADAADSTGQLRCTGSNTSAGTQSIAADVADFQVRWRRQRIVGGQPVLDIVDTAAAEADWTRIYAADVCIEMAGSERIDTGTSTYRPCGWTDGDDESNRGNRLRLVYRTTFQLRTQGAL